MLAGKVAVHELGEELKQKLLDVFGSPLQVRFNNICTGHDFKTFFPLGRASRVFSGRVSISSDADQSLWRQLDTLRLHVSGGVAFCDGVVMVLYPADMEAWNFLETSSKPPDQDAQLRFQIFAAKDASLAISTLADGGGKKDSISPPYRHHVQNIFKLFYNVTYSRLLADRNVPHFFLVIAPSKVAELRLYVEFLRLSGAKNIYHSLQEGAWDYFGDQHDRGTVLIHPSFTAIHRIPSLVHLLRKTFTVYRFGLDEGTDPNDGKTSTGSGQFICTRLFSHGGAILLTDSLVLENPIACDRIVRWFGDKLKLRAPNTWKLVGRPGFKDWVLAVANERGDGDGLRSAEFKARYRIWLALDELLPSHLATHVAINDNDSGNDEQLITFPTDDAPLYWESDIPGYPALSETIPNTGNTAPPSTSTTSPSSPVSSRSRLEEAHDKALAAWFCGWALTKVENYRRFIIVHSESLGTATAAMAAAAAATPAGPAERSLSRTPPPTVEELKFSEAVDVVTPERFFTTYT